MELPAGLDGFLPITANADERVVVDDGGSEVDLFIVDGLEHDQKEDLFE